MDQQRLKALDKLSEIFNKFIYDLRPGDLVLVSNLTLKSDYNIDVPSSGYKAGIVIEAITNNTDKIFSEKLYKVLICDRIILLKIKDIQEKLN